MTRTMTSQTSAALANHRVLVVEDEYLIAEEIAAALAGVEAEVIGPVRGVEDALGLLEANSRVDAALLDVNLRGRMVWPLVDALLARGVPLVLATGYDASMIPPDYAGLPRCQKPVSTQDIVRALARALATRPG